MQAVTLLNALNGLLTITVLIVAFSLLAYVALQNWRNDMARAVSVLLAAVVIVYAGDVLLDRAQTTPTIETLLRAQWLGITLVPAAYMHLSDALLSYSGHRSRRRRLLVVAAYVASLVFSVLAVSGRLLAGELVYRGKIAQLSAGPLFWLFVVYFVGGASAALVNVLRARRRALAPTLRRRFTYLVITFVAPAIGVFPYLAATGGPGSVPESLIFALSIVGSLGIATMITLMTYSISSQGLPMPDRLIKYDFLRWGLYGPVVGITIILFLQVVPITERLIGLPPNTLVPFGVMIMTVLMPVVISKARPYLDALIYRQDQEEFDFLRTLPRRMFTQTDLRQLLENTLIAVCGTLGVETGFVIGPAPDGYRVKALCGSRREVKRFASTHALPELVARLGTRGNGKSDDQAGDPFLHLNSFALMPLQAPDGSLIGALGVETPPHGIDADARRLIKALAHQMAVAITAVQMQQQVVTVLRSLDPEMQTLQTLSSQLDQATPATLEHLDPDVALLPEFPQLVKEALAHYWGGTKLSDSPLLRLRTVRRHLAEHGGSPTRALQAVLRQAIENLRPTGQLDLSAQEWLLYNILELRFLQGRLVRDAADRLAMSESDFYRKQRVAIEELAHQLALMEERDGETHPAGRR